MDQDEARHYIRESWRDIMQFMTSEARDSANGETSYVCPLCGHGENGDGLTYNPKSEDGNSLHCFGCNFSGDIFDLIGKEYGFYNDSRFFSRLFSFWLTLTYKKLTFSFKSRLFHPIVGVFLRNRQFFLDEYAFRSLKKLTQTYLSYCILT